MSEPTTLENQAQTQDAIHQQDLSHSQGADMINVKADPEQTQSEETKKQDVNGNPNAEQNQPEETKINTEFINKANLQIKNIDLLLEGLVFMKHSKWSDPAYKTVRISDCLTKVEWFSRGQAKPKNHILLSKLVGVRFGRRSANFKRQKIKSFAQEQRSFSLLGEDKTLDLEADLKEQMEMFLEGLWSVIEYHKKNNPDFLKGSAILGKKTK